MSSENKEENANGGTKPGLFSPTFARTTELSPEPPHNPTYITICRLSGLYHQALYCCCWLKEVYVSLAAGLTQHSTRSIFKQAFSDDIEWKFNILQTILNCPECF